MLLTLYKATDLMVATALGEKLSLSLLVQNYLNQTAFHTDLMRHISEDKPLSRT